MPAFLAQFTAAASLIVVVAVTSLASPPLSASETLAVLSNATGCAVWEHHTHFARVIGRQAGDELDGSFEELVDFRTPRYTVTSHGGGFSWGNGYDGSVAWERDFSATTHLMDAPSAVALGRTESWIATNGWCRNGATYRIEAGALVARPTGGAPVALYVDRHTGLLDRAVLRYDENHSILDFSDWRTVDGVAVPFFVRTVDPEDDETSSQTIQGFEPLRTLPTKAFNPPPTVSRVTLSGGARSTTVAYVDDGNKPIVNVRIDGEGPFPFVLDTGGHFILTGETARRLGLLGIGSESSTNERRVTKVRFVRVPHVQVGAARIDGLVAEVDPYGFNKLERGPRPPKAGWIGLEFFERFAVTFDPRVHELTLRSLTVLRPRAPGTKLALFFDSDSPLVKCSIAGKRGVCLVDTGNAGATIVAPIWARRKGLEAQFLRGINVEGRNISRATVSLGPFALPKALVSYVPSSAPGAELFNVEAAALSEQLIGRFVATFDYARRGLWLESPGAYRPAPFNRSGIVARKQQSGDFTVAQILAPSPAKASAIRPGDVIVTINGMPAWKFSGADFVRINATTAKLTLLVRRGTRTFRAIVTARDDLLPSR